MHPTMEHAMARVATALLGKLSSLVEKEYSQLKGVREDIIYMHDELRSMNAALSKLAAEDDPDVQVKEWRNQIQDLFYDVEDCVDDFLHRVEHGHGQPDVGLFHRSFAKLKSLVARRDIAEKIRHLKARVDAVSKRRGRYKLEGASSSIPAAVVPIDTWLPALYPSAGSLVGIDGPREEIVKLLTQGEENLRKSLKVVSITGFGGLGKTTLAYAVYRKLLGDKHFDCKVNVSVSQSPDIIKILTKILTQAKEQPPSHMCSDQHELTEELRNYLLHKRYLVIIDDIWKEDVWTVLRCAFPENDKGSRVIITTRLESVASACCTHRHECIYKMNPLSGEDSKKLFFARIFGSDDGACPSELKEVSSQILRKCGGLPLAIITIASLLASQETRVKEYWEYVQNSMGSIVGTDRRLEVMRGILNLSYRDLPRHLKTCFLYLGAYREDSVVWRDDLVRQWVAEGFVDGMHWSAVNCFHELVNRSMIQPVMIGYNGEVLSCRVHDMMLDLIIRKYSEEENFLTVVENSSQGVRVRGSTHNVRRLFHQSDEERRRHLMRWTPAMNIDLSKVRSFSACGSSTQGRIPPLSEFRFIRVLILEFLFARVAAVAETVNLRAICKLFQLRYLKIRSEVELLLPSQIRGLQHLQTLEIVSVLPSRRLVSIALPSDVAQLPCLSHLNILPQMAGLPDGIGAMRSLHSLAFFVLEENSLDNIKGIQNLSNLKELYVRVPVDQRFYETAEARVEVLCSSLPEHCKLYLNALSREAWFSRVPQWISRLEKLYSLELGVDELCRDGIAVLAGLPALARLDLSIRGVPRESAIISGEGFPELKRLIITSRTLRLTFEPRAMPRLQRLKLEFNVDAEQGGCGNVIAGVEHLSGLTKITARIGGFGGATDTEDSGPRVAAVSALKDAIGSLPRPVELDITCMQGRYGLT